MLEPRSILAGLAIMAISGAAAAQEADSYDWTGPYLGGYVAYSSFAVDVSDVSGRIANDAPSLTQTQLAAGLVGGANWQLPGAPGLVVGFEVDLATEHAQDETFAPNSANLSGVEYDLRLNRIGSVSARVGVPSGRALFFMAGGFSHAEVDMKTYAFDRARGQTDCGSSICAASDEQVIGMNFGLGVDYATTDNLVVRFDIRHYAFDTLNADVLNSAGQPACQGGAGLSCSVAYDPSLTQMRLGFFYKF